jgi:ABC-type amino acid transport substrate-binding protein
MLAVSVTPFDGIFGALNSKKCDAVISSVTITDDRKKEMAFSEPYFDSNQSLMVRQADATTLKLLNDGLATAKSDGTYDTLFEKYFGTTP